jgi:iron(III) transport system permease protein
MFNTLWLGIAVAVIGALTGAVLAVLLVRTSLPGKALFDGLVWVTLFTPSYLVALAWELLFSRGGFIDTTIVPLPDGVVTTIFSPVGLTILLVLRLFPFSFLAVRAALGGLGSEYEEAGRMVGAGTLRCWLRINGPLLAPALFAGGLIIFAEAISDYGTAATIAQQAGFNLVTYELYAAINNEPVDFAMSAALLVQARLLRARSYQVITGRTRQARPALLGRWRWPLTAALGVFFFVALGLP